MSLKLFGQREMKEKKNPSFLSTSSLVRACYRTVRWNPESGLTDQSNHLWNLMVWWEVLPSFLKLGVNNPTGIIMLDRNYAQLCFLQLTALNSAVILLFSYFLRMLCEFMDIHIYWSCFFFSKSLQLGPTVWELMNCNSPGCSIHGILQARILEWVSMPFSRVSSRDQTPISYISCIGRQGSLPLAPPGKPYQS